MTIQDLIDFTEDLLCRKRLENNDICSTVYLGTTYLYFFGLLGILFASIEIRDMILNGPVLPKNMRRRRVTGAVISPSTERDIKLLTDFTSIFFYILLCYGAYTNDIFFVYPWFFMHNLILFGEIVIFLSRMLNCQSFHMSKEEIFCTLFSIFNWLQVSCSIRNNCKCRI